MLKPLEQPRTNLVVLWSLCCFQCGPLPQPSPSPKTRGCSRVGVEALSPLLRLPVLLSTPSSTSLLPLFQLAGRQKASVSTQSFWSKWSPEAWGPSCTVCVKGSCGGLVLGWAQGLLGGGRRGEPALPTSPDLRSGPSRAQDLRPFPAAPARSASQRTGSR